MYSRLARLPLNMLNTRSNLSLQHVGQLGSLLNARVSASSVLPLTLRNATSLDFSHPLPSQASRLFANWQTRALNSHVTPTHLLNAFKPNAKISTPAGMSAAALLSMPNEHVIGNISLIVDSFFPVDPPKDSEHIIYINEDFRKAFRQHASAREFQAEILLKITEQLGFTLQNNILCLKPDFSAKQAMLLTTPNGRSCLAQIIRSAFMLGNEQLATQLQSLLLALALRYRIAPGKMADIALATRPDYWQKRDLFPLDPVKTASLIDTLLKREPSHCFLNLHNHDDGLDCFAFTGNQSADFLLGIAPNHQGLYLKEILQKRATNPNLVAEQALFESLFPTDVASGFAKPLVTADTKRCFRTNPLLRSAHRQAARLILDDFGLINTKNKDFSIKPGLSVQALSWLMPENKAQRQALLRLIKSLDLLQNTEFAHNIRAVILEQIHQHYRGADKASVVQSFSQVITQKATKPLKTAKSDSSKPLIPKSLQTALLFPSKPKAHQELVIQEEKTQATVQDINPLTSKKQQILAAIQAFFTSKDPTELKNYLDALEGMALLQHELIEVLSQKNRYGFNLLEVALAIENPTLVKAIVDAMLLISDPSTRATLIQEQGKTLNIAVSYKNVTALGYVLDLLQSFPIEARFACFKQSCAKVFALYLAAQNNQQDALKALMGAIQAFSQEQQAEIFLDSVEDGRTALYIAVQKNHLDCAKAIFAHILNLKESEQKRLLSMQTKMGKSILMQSAQNGLLAMAEAVLEAVEPFDKDFIFSVFNAVDINGNNALALAITSKHTEIVKLLLRKINALRNHQLVSDCLNIQNSDDETALDLAVKSGQQEIVQAILTTIKPFSSEQAKEALSIFDPNELSDDDDEEQELDLSGSPLFLAASAGHKKITQALVQAMLDLEHSDGERDFLLTLFKQAQKAAKENGHTEIEQLLGQKRDSLEQQFSLNIASAKTVNKTEIYSFATLEELLDNKIMNTVRQYAANLTDPNARTQLKAYLTRCIELMTNRDFDSAPVPEKSKLDSLIPSLKESLDQQISAGSIKQLDASWLAHYSALLQASGILLSASEIKNDLLNAPMHAVRPVPTDKLDRLFALCRDHASKQRLEKRLDDKLIDRLNQLISLICHLCLNGPNAVNIDPHWRVETLIPKLRNLDPGIDHMPRAGVENGVFKRADQPNWQPFNEAIDYSFQASKAHITKPKIAKPEPLNPDSTKPTEQAQQQTPKIDRAPIIQPTIPKPKTKQSKGLLSQITFQRKEKNKKDKKDKAPKVSSAFKGYKIAKARVSNEARSCIENQFGAGQYSTQFDALSATQFTNMLAPSIKEWKALTKQGLTPSFDLSKPNFQQEMIDTLKKIHKEIWELDYDCRCLLVDYLDYLERMQQQTDWQLHSISPAWLEQFNRLLQQSIVMIREGSNVIYSKFNKIDEYLALRTHANSVTGFHRLYSDNYRQDYQLCEPEYLVDLVNRLLADELNELQLDQQAQLCQLTSLLRVIRENIRNYDYYAIHSMMAFLDLLHYKVFSSRQYHSAEPKFRLWAANFEVSLLKTRDVLINQVA